MQRNCEQCGARLCANTDSCPQCGTGVGGTEGRRKAHAAWAERRDSLKLRWVISVVAFWVSGAVLVAVYFAKGRLDPLVASIVLGLMMAGVALKAKYQLHLRKEPDKPSDGG